MFILASFETATPFRHRFEKPMVQPNKPPRLWKRPNGRGKSSDTPWIIKHNGKQFSTFTVNREKAEDVLRQYASCPKYFRHKQVKRKGRLEAVDKVWLYFIEIQAEDKPVKIGIAKDIRARLWNLQVSTPFEMVVLASLEVFRMVERILHERLEPYRIRGEWYRRSPEVNAAIEAAKLGKITEFVDVVDVAA